MALVVSKGTTPTSIGLNFSNNGVPFIRGEDVVGSSVDFNQVKMFINDHSHNILKRSALMPGDVLVTIAGTIGRTGYVDKQSKSANCNQAVAFIRLPLNRVDPIWLCALLSSPKYQAKFGKFVAGGAIPNVNLEQIKSLEIPLIDIGEQRQIAANLKTQIAEVDTARKALEVQQADIKLFAATALDKLYSTPNKERIGNIAKVQSGYAFKSKDFITQGIKLLRNTNILPNKVYWDETAYLPSESFAQYPNYVINEGDVILSLDRPIISTGIKVARISDKDIPALLVQRVGRFLIDKNRIDPGYLYFFLNTSFFKDAISGHEQSLGVPHISPTQVESVEIPLPNINEQKKIAAKALEVFKQTEIAKIAAKESQKDIEYLSSRLLAQAFDPLSAQ